MKFKADKYKVVRLGNSKYAVFASGEFETTDKHEIELLSNAKGVNSVTKKVKSAKSK
mgnify:CR=1 FL=1